MSRRDDHRPRPDFVRLRLRVWHEESSTAHTFEVDVDRDALLRRPGASSLEAASVLVVGEVCAATGHGLVSGYRCKVEVIDAPVS